MKTATLSRWLSAFGTCPILEVAHPRTAREILASGGSWPRQLPGQPVQYLRDDVERIARESVASVDSARHSSANAKGAEPGKVPPLSLCDSDPMASVPSPGNPQTPLEVALFDEFTL